MQVNDDDAVFKVWSRKEFAAIGCDCQSCGRQKALHLWIDLCKKNYGILTIKQVKERLRCSSCGARPDVVRLLTYGELSGWR